MEQQAMMDLKPLNNISTLWLDNFNTFDHMQDLIEELPTIIDCLPVRRVRMTSEQLRTVINEPHCLCISDECIEEMCPCSQACLEEADDQLMMNVALAF